MEGLVDDMKTWTAGEDFKNLMTEYTKNVDDKFEYIQRAMCAYKTGERGECGKPLLAAFSEQFTDWQETMNKNNFSDSRVAIIMNNVQYLHRPLIEAKMTYERLGDEIVNEILDELVSGFEKNIANMNEDPDKELPPDKIYTSRISTLNHVPILRKIGKIVYAYTVIQLALDQMRKAYKLFSIDWQGNTWKPKKTYFSSMDSTSLSGSFRTLQDIQHLKQLTQRLARASLKARMNTIWARAFEKRRKASYHDIPQKFRIVHDVARIDTRNTTWTPTFPKPDWEYGCYNRYHSKFNFDTQDSFFLYMQAHEGYGSCGSGYYDYSDHTHFECRYFLQV